MPVKKDEIYRDVEITGIGADGVGVGHIDGMAVFVGGAVRGDIADVKINRVKKNFAEGEIERIITPSKNRITPECPYFGSCGGCHTANRNYETELSEKSEMIEQAMRRIGGFGDFEIEKIESGRNKRYRNKAVYKIGKNPVSCGFFSAKSHDVVSVGDCLLCSADDRKITAALVDYINKNDVKNITSLFLRRSHTSGEIMAAVKSEGKIANEAELAERLRAAGATSAAVNSKTIFGADFINDELLGVKFRISEKSFYQVNPEMTERLYAKALEYAALTGKERVLDIYCGIGTISLCAAKSAAEVIGVEIVPEAVVNARENAKINKIKNAVFYADSAENIVPKLIQNGAKPDVVILDPPRKGSDPATLAAILKAAPERIVYVSCNPSTLARDAKTLFAGGYQISAAQAFDMFPKTGHVETVVMLSHKEQGG